MSDVPADYRELLDLRTVIAEIDRKRAETQKLQEEREKFIAERRKFDRDWWVVPLTVFGVIVAGVVARLPEILHAIRWGIPQ